MSKIPKQSAAAWLALLAAIGIVFACRPNSFGQQSSTLTVAVQADVMGLFPSPRIPGDTYTIHLNANIFEGLVGLDANLKIVPSLARRWENPDARTWVFHLQEDRFFSDGRPVTAADVVASFEASREKVWQNRYFLRSIKTTRALSPTRVEITTKEPDPLLLSQLPWGFVVPAEAAARQDTPSIGTGPYRVEFREPGRQLVLARNVHHPGPPPDFDRVRFMVVADDRERVEKVLRGQADLADSIPLEGLEKLRAHPETRVIVRPGLFVLYLVMRVDRKPFSDPRVREAIELAIDRPLLIERTLAGLAEPAYQAVPSTVAGFNPVLATPRTDPARARRLLASAGYTHGLSMRLDGPTDRYTGDEQILGEIARQLGEVGIQVEVNALGKAEFFQALDRGPVDFHMVGWSSDSGDAAGVLEAVFHTAEPDGPIGNGNTMGLSDPQLDRLIDGSLRSGTLMRRSELLRQAMARVAELRPVIPLVVEVEGFLLSQRILWEPPLNLAIRATDFRKANP